MTLRTLSDGYELDDDPSRIDVAAVVSFLSTNAYWAIDRPPAVIARGIANSFRVVGLYWSGAQVGFARAVSDGEIIAYLADVYVLPEHRGRGLGTEIVTEIIDTGPIAHVRWLLHTKDAHSLYRRFAFQPPDDRALQRERTGYRP
ncbi:MAG: GNAT family N-acetyltransferase [Actinomycetota bacterium]